MDRLIKNLKISLRGIKVLFEIEKFYTIIYICESVLKPVTTYVNIFMMARIIDLLAKQSSFKTLLYNIGFTVGLNFLIALLVSALTKLRMYHNEQLTKNEKVYFAERTMNLIYPLIEDAKITMLRNQIEQESRSGFNIFYLNMFIGDCITSIVNVVMAFSLSVTFFINKDMTWWLRLCMLVIIALVIVINLSSTKHSNDLINEMYQKMVPFNTTLMFYAQYIEDYNAGKDIRLYHMQDYFLNINAKNFKEQNELVKETRSKSLKYVVSKSIISDILTGVTYIILLYLCFYGNLSVGSITKYVASITLFVKGVGDMVSGFQSMFNNNNYLVTYFKYLDLPQVTTESKKYGKEQMNSDKFELEFRHVSFKYPNEEDYVLKDVSFHINDKDTVALVGENGCGKTTLIKLICRFYEDYEGDILLNGINIKEYSYSEYNQIISSVFQDFLIFGFTLAENIVLADEMNSERLMEALDKVGMKENLSKFESGIDTYLKNDYESGYEISGGEAQKIALARALYKKSSMIVLDEPTAALDPKSEYEVFTNMKKNTDGRTALFVSHRMGVCRTCDKILVLDHGTLVQDGTHEEMMKDVNGKYYSLWNAQASYYLGH